MTDFTVRQHKMIPCELRQKVGSAFMAMHGSTNRKTRLSGGLSELAGWLCIGLIPIPLSVSLLQGPHKR